MRRCTGQRLGDGADPVAAQLFAPVAREALAVQAAARLGGAAALKVLLHHSMHVLLVALEAEHVVRTALLQLPGNALLAADGVNGDDAALQVQHAQQLGDGADFVAFAIDLALTQQEPHVGCPGADQVQRFGPVALATAAHALAVDGYRALHLAGELLEPLQTSPLRLLSVQQTKHPGKGVVRGHP